MGLIHRNVLKNTLSSCLVLEGRGLDRLANDNMGEFGDPVRTYRHLNLPLMYLNWPTYASVHVCGGERERKGFCGFSCIIQESIKTCCCLSSL